MNEIKINKKTVALFHKKSDWREGLNFLTSNESYIQAGTWWYNEGHKLKAHKHILHERSVDLTQETIIIMSGKLQVNLYDEKGEIFHQEILTEGDIGVILSGGHGYLILSDNTKVVEIKNGPFFSVDKDKELLNI